MTTVVALNTVWFEEVSVITAWYHVVHDTIVSIPCNLCHFGLTQVVIRKCSQARDLQSNKEEVLTINIRLYA